MLTLMRKLLRSKFSGVIFGLLILAMAAWGVTDVFSGGLGSNLAAAGDRTLSIADFDETVERELSRAARESGQSMTKAEADQQGIIDSLYQREQFRLVLGAYGDRLGVSTSDRQVRDVITSTDAFKTETGSFDPQLYRATLQNAGFTPASYEEIIESDLTSEVIQEMATAGLKVPSVLAQLQAGYLSEKRTADWLVITEAMVGTVADPTEEELRTYYDERQDALRVPERRIVSVIALDEDDFRSTANISEDDVVALYEALKAEQFTTPDTRTYTEFVFETEDVARSDLGRIAGGASADRFPDAITVNERTGKQAEMASADLASRVFASSALPGAVFGPVQTGQYWTVARLEAVTPGDTIPLDQVRDEVVEELAAQEAAADYLDAQADFDSLIGTGADLESLSEDLGTPVLTFAPVDRSGRNADGRVFPLLLESDDILQRAFDLAEGGQSRRLGDSNNTYMVRVDSVIPASVPEFEEVEDRLRAVWKREKQTTALQDKANAIQLAIESGASTLAAQAAELGTEVQSMSQPVTPTQQAAELPRSVGGTLFALRQIGDMQVGPGNSPNEYVILQLTSIDRPEGADLEALAPAMAASLEPTLANDLFEAFAYDIQTTIKLKSNGNALAGYKSQIAPQ